MIWILTAYIDAKYQMGWNGQYWGALVIDVLLIICAAICYETHTNKK